MKKDDEYLIFEQINNFPKSTNKWICKNKKSQESLGIIKWHSAWRQYCYFPTVWAIYSSGCLNYISNFVYNENENHKQIIKINKTYK
jgi:hypothetical protein